MPKDLVWLRAVFQKLKEAGIKFKPRKSEFLKKSFTYLGHKNSVEVVKWMTVKLKWYANGLLPKQWPGLEAFQDLQIITVNLPTCMHRSPDLYIN